MDHEGQLASVFMISMSLNNAAFYIDVRYVYK